MVTRRCFISVALLLLAKPTRVFGFPLPQVLGSQPPNYVRAYFSRFLKWYSQEYYSFEKHMSDLEKSLFHSWKAQVNEFGIHREDDFRETLLVRYHLRDQ